MSDKDADHTEDNYDGLAAGTLFGRTFLEKLLLSIIEAHPIGQDATENRLSVALRALTGENSKVETVKQDSDLPALRHMAAEHYRDKGNRFLIYMQHRTDEAPPELPKIRSDLVLAKQAADKFFDPSNQQVRKSIYDRLREKFSGAYYRKQGKGHGVNFRENFIYQAVEHDYVAETLEAQGLDSICAELRKYGVNTVR